jgi:LPXTG-motif cell wall-anchored protein
MFVVPEIDPSLGIGGLALLSGVVLMVRGRRRR